MLLLAVKDEGMMDPGALSAKNTPTSFEPVAQSNPATQDDAVVHSKSLAGSLLAVILHEPPPEKTLLKPFSKLHRLLTSRTLVYGGPLITQGTRLQQEMILKLLLDGLDTRVKKRSLFTQFRNSFEINDLIPLFREMGYRWRDHLNLLLDTSTREVAWQNLNYKRRKQVRLSIRNGARVVENPSPGQIQAFYAMLRQLYDNKVKKPLPGFAFFQALHHSNARYFLICHSGKLIGGAVCVFMKGKCMHEWYAFGLDREYKHLQIYPSVMATWSAIAYAADNDIPCFDFMGMGKPDVPYGVRAFKKKFGGKMINPGRFYKINRRTLYHLAEIGYNVLFFLKR